MSNGPDYSRDHLNTEQVKVCYSDKFVIRMFAIQIPSAFLFTKWYSFVNLLVMLTVAIVLQCENLSFK